MAKRISKQDATGDFPSALDELKAKFGSLDTAIHASDELVKMFKTDIGKLRKEISGIDMGSVKGIKEFNAKQKDAQKIMLDTAKLEQQNIKLLQEKEKLKQQELRTQKLLNSEKKKELTAYQLESKALNELRDRYKHLAVQKMNGVKLTKDEEKEYRRLIPQIRQTDAALKKIDATGGQFQRNVGNYPKVMNGFKNALGQLGLAFGAFQLAAGFGKTLVNFEEQAANMAKTLGVTVEEAKNLSRELANIDTRTSISDLQTIAAIGGQLGIEANQVVAFTESIDKLNVALGDEFTGGAEEITSVLGGMRNVLTDIKTDNAADDLLKLGNALNYIGAKGSATSPVMADFASRISGIGIPLGLTSDEVIGLSATLQELNINAERGGTAVGAILQRITRDTKGFAELANMDVKKFENLLNTDLLGAFKAVTKGFSTLKGDAVTQSKILEKLGLTGSGASEVFLKLGSSVDLLDTRVKQAGESLKNTDSITDEFNVKNNTLGATMDKLTKEFQKYVIGVDESGMVTGGLSSTLQFLVNNFDALVTTTEYAVELFLIYKTRLLAMNVAQKLFGDGTGKMNIGLKQLVSNVKDSTSTTNNLASSLKGGLWAAAIAVVLEMASAFISIASSAENARIQAETLRRAEEKAAKVSDRIYNREKKNIEDRLQKYKDVNKFSKFYGKSEIDIQTQVTKEIKRRRDELQAQLIRYQNEQIQSQDVFSKYSKAYQKTETARIDGQVEGTRRALDALDEYEESLKNEVETQKISVSGVGNKTKATKELNTQLKEQNEYLSKQKDLLHELGQAYVEFDIEDISDRIELLKEKTFDLARETGNIDNEALKEAITERMQAQESSIDSILIYEIEAIRERYRIEKEEARRAIEDNRTELLSQKDLTDSERLKIEKDYQEKLRKLNEDNKQRDEDRDTEIRIKESKASRDKIKLKKDTSKELEDIEKQTIEKIEEFNTEEEAKQLKRSQELDELEAKKLKERYENQKKWIELTTKLWEDNIDKKIALLDKESEAHKNQYEYYKSLADSGTINKKESMAEEARLQREAEKEKAKLEQRKLYIQAFSAFMTNYTNRLENGENSTEALAGAVADKAVLEAILATLPAFFEGTESTGKTSNPLDSNGGRVALLHDNERVLTAKQNKPLLDMGISNPDIVKYVQMGVIAESIESGDRAGNSFDIKPLLEKFDKLEKTIQNLPQVDYQYDKAIDGLFTVIKTTKRGNLTTRTETQFRPR